ncbi:MAG: helix-turn-helix domain-containing protein [Actinobacteria bacterium]|nr:helix-turn-helix domain-containing protein [Actinomycetota bacterium]
MEAGARVRALRLDRGLSLTALAAAAGIGKGSLSELEAGRRNPTLDTLYAVAGPLGVPLAALVDDRDGTVVPGETLDAVRLHVLVEADRTTEVYLLRLAAGRTRRSPAHAAGAIEQLIVLAGECRVEVGGAAPSAREVPTGAHLAWAADVPHAYTAGPGPDLRAVNVITTPTTPPTT